MWTKEAMLGQNLKEHNKVAMYKISYKIQLSCYIVIKTNRKTIPLVVKIIEQVGMKLVKIVWHTVYWKLRRVPIKLNK